MNHCLLFNVIDLKKHKSARTGGVYRIAHFLRQNGWDVEVIDYATSWSLRELQELCKSRVTSYTKFFGFSHMFSNWTDTLEDFIKWSRTRYPTVKYISGSGVNPMFNSKQIDYYVQGYGEYAILSLLNYLFSNGKRPKFWLNSGRKIINAISDYPAYPIRDLTIDYQVRDYIEPWEWLTMEFSRGCMFACDFCNFPLIGLKGDMTRDADNFDLEMKKNYDKWGTQNYIVTDETFNDRTEKIRKFADVVEKLNFETFFSGFVRVDLMISRKSEIEDLARMNFRGHYYGIESFNYKTAKSVGKGMHPDKVKQGLIDIRKYFESTGFYRGTIGLIVGLPYEDVNSLHQTKNWLSENWKSQSLITWALSIPNSEIDIQSKFSDYTKYGYSRMTDEEIKNNQLLYDKNYKQVVHDESMLWKNEHMNYIQAENISMELFNNNHFHTLMDNKCDNFELADIALAGKDLSSRFNVRTSRFDDEIKTYMVSTIRDHQIDIYKQRKLSL